MPKQFKDGDGKVVGEVAVIARYFRRQEETLGDMSAQIKVLTPEAKTELAVGAAKELGFECIGDVQ